MKRSLLVLGILSLVSSNALPQGYVNFNNNGLFAGNPPSVLVYLGDPAKGGTPLVGTNWLAQLYYGAQGSPESNLIPVESAPAHFRVPTTSNPGTWSGGTRDLVGFSGNDTVFLQVKVWDGALFPTYEAALGASGITGKSILFNFTICPPGSCGGPNPEAMANFRGFNLVPGMPPLSAILSRNQNQLILSWPTNLAGFTLQSSSSLSANA